MAAANEQSPFLFKAREALVDLFDKARAKDELNYAMSLVPEPQPYLLTSAMEAPKAYEDYRRFLEAPSHVGKSIWVRVALAWYCYTAEASGLWGVPRSLLAVLGGETSFVDPWTQLVQRHKVTQKTIAPNAGKVMKHLAEVASALGLLALSEVFRDAFDGDLRNAYAHADYALSPEGILVRGRHDKQRLISWSEFQRLLRDGVDLFDVLRNLIRSRQEGYTTARVVHGRINDKDPSGWYLIYSDDAGMRIGGGPGCTREELLNQHQKRRAQQN